MVPKLHPNQQRIYEGLARFTVVACGRRFGKTVLDQRVAIDKVVAGLRVGLLYPSWRSGTETWETLANLLEPITTYVHNGDRRLSTSTGGLLRLWSIGDMALKSIRGTYLDYVIFDEAAFNPTGHAWERVIRPMLLDTVGGALFTSSPNGLNWFWNLYNMGLDPNNPDWRSFWFTSYDNPEMPVEEIDAARNSLPDGVFKQEYMAEFLPDTGAVFRHVSKVCVLPPENQTPQEGHKYVMGIDWGQSNDFTVISIMDATTGRQVYIERFKEIGWAVQTERVIAAQQVWGCAVIWAEANAMGGPNIESLQGQGLPVRAFTTTAISKGPLIQHLVLAIERAAAALSNKQRPQLLLLNDRVMMLELQSYKGERSPGGGIKYSSPAGGHDDTVIATALSWYGVLHGAIAIDFA